jgi:hypothetical protein
VGPPIHLFHTGYPLLSLKNHIKRLLNDRLEINPNHGFILRIIFQRVGGSGISRALEFNKQFNYAIFFFFRFGFKSVNGLFVEGWVEHPDIFCWVSFLYPTYLPAIFVLSVKPNKMVSFRFFILKSDESPGRHKYTLTEKMEWVNVNSIFDIFRFCGFF